VRIKSSQTFSMPQL